MTLNIQNLSKRYGDVAVFANVSVTVAPGEFVAIVGESGVGKSTLLNCMAGLDTWDTGTVALQGIDLAALTDDQRALLRRDKVGFVFQAFHVLPHLDVAQNVALPLLLQGGVDHALVDARGATSAEGSAKLQGKSSTTSAQATHDRVQAMLNAVGLEGLGARLPQQLSGGQLQRVSIARALVHRPALLLADEPTGNLDPSTAARVMDALISQTRLHHASLVLVTHSEAAAARADRVLKLKPDGI
jgi:putative ABC transport system ATP-binding protein